MNTKDKHKRLRQWNACDFENVQQHVRDVSVSLASFLSPRTELHFNHLAENSAFGILPQSKVITLDDLAERMCLLEGFHIFFMNFAEAYI